MYASIINIGNELLSGKTINTNGSFIAEQIAKIGISTKDMLCIADDKKELQDKLNALSDEISIVIITGGLGPTKDDMTKHILADYFGVGMKKHQQTEDLIRSFLQKRNMPATAINLNQALVPENAIVLLNPIGTAPGMAFETEKRMYFSLPGVPFEMRNLMEIAVLPFLKKKLDLQRICVKDVHTQGMGESFLSEKIADWEDNLPAEISLAYLPSPATVKLRLTARGEDENRLKKIIDKEVLKLQKAIPELIWGYDNDSLEEIIGNLCRKKKWKLGAAESCTGGYIAHLITSVAGASDYFSAAIVAYENRVKEKQLGVNAEDLMKYGAVSEQVVKQMAKGWREKMNLDIVVSTSGIAGPGGATAEKPVGTVWIGISTAEKTIAKKFIFGDNRERNIIRSSYYALNMLRKAML